MTQGPGDGKRPSSGQLFASFKDIVNWLNPEKRRSESNCPRSKSCMRCMISRSQVNRPNDEKKIEHDEEGLCSSRKAVYTSSGQYEYKKLMGLLKDDYPKHRTQSTSEVSRLPQDRLDLIQSQRQQFDLTDLQRFESSQQRSRFGTAAAKLPTKGASVYSSLSKHTNSCRAAQPHIDEAYLGYRELEKKLDVDVIFFERTKEELDCFSRYTQSSLTPAPRIRPLHNSRPGSAGVDYSTKAYDISARPRTASSTEKKRGKMISTRQIFPATPPKY